MQQQKSQQRLVAIDAMRGLAIVLMIVYHLIFDLRTFYDLQLSSEGLVLWEIVGTSAALFFFLIFGISGAFAWQKHKDHFWRFSLRRGSIILFFAFCVSVFSILFDTMSPIYFGVLHFLGISALLLPLFVGFVWIDLVLAVFCVIIAFALEQGESNSVFLLPLGSYDFPVATADYYPLFPWFGFILCGIFLGKIALRHSFFSRIGSSPKLLNPLAYLGKHSLLIYLVHQPILMGILSFGAMFVS